MARVSISSSTAKIKVSDIERVVGKGLKNSKKKFHTLANEARIAIETNLQFEYAKQLKKRRKMHLSLKTEFQRIVRFESDSKLSRITEVRKKLKRIGSTKIQSNDFFIVKARLLNKKPRKGSLGKMETNSFHGLWYIHEYNQTRDGKKNIYPKGKLLAFPQRKSGVPKGASPRDYEGRWVDVGLSNMAVFISNAPDVEVRETGRSGSSYKRIRPQTSSTRASTVKSRSLRNRRPRLGKNLQEAPKSIRYKSIEMGQQVVSVEKNPLGKLTAKSGKKTEGRVLFIGLPSLPVSEMTGYVSGNKGPFRKAVDIVGRKVPKIVDRVITKKLESMSPTMKKITGF
jgi:hypothetical protein